MMPRIEPAPIAPEEVPEFVGALLRAFHREPRPDEIERYSPLVEPERSLAVRDRGSIVGTTSIFSRRMAIPGGEVPVAGVTLVGVQPSHRRRGLMTALMHRQLADVHESGTEAIAALWASETAIYDRFGYGLASMAAELDVRTREARLRRPVTASVELGRPADALPAMAAIYEAGRHRRAGMLDRVDPWWEKRIADPENRRHGADALLAAVIEGAAYALYAVKDGWEGGRPAAEVTVREVVALDRERCAAIWSFLLGLDLTHRLVYDLAPADHPLPHMVTEAQTVQMRMSDALHVRLVDVPRALAERAYAEPFEVVLEVADAVCPWNAGRWALAWDGATATCEATSAPAELALGVAELGAAYLGGTALDALAGAGRVEELRAGALAVAGRAFRGERAPWCPEIF